MATGSSSSSKKSPVWHADWFVGVLIVLLVYVFNMGTNFLDGLENRFYDLGITQASKKPSDQIALVAIDDNSVNNIGRWPWSRDIQAKLIDQISAGKPKAIVNSIGYFEPQLEKGLPYLQKIRESISAEAISANPALESISKIADEGVMALNADARLAQSLAAAGNVIGFVTFTSGDVRGKQDKPLADISIKSLAKSPPGFGFEAGGIQEPIAILASKFAAVGSGNKSVDIDGSVRTEPLLMDYYGQMLPSLALQGAMKALNLEPSDLKALPEEPAVVLGKLRIGTDDKAYMRPFYYGDNSGKAPFGYDSAFDVMSGKVPASKYAGKIVVLGPTAAGLGVEFPSPLGRNMTPLEQTGHVISSILSEHFVTMPWWTDGLKIALSLLIAAYLIVLLPRLPGGSAAVATSVLFIALLLGSFIVLSRFSVWIQLVFPAFLLIVGHLALTTKRFLMTEAGKLKSDEESAETNRMMGLALQGQGQLDMAFDRFRRVPTSDALLDNMGNLALDFERKRQFNKAQAVYEYMATLDKNHKGLQAKLNRAKNLSETVILGGGNAHPGGNTIRLDGSGVEKPMLGRYQVEKELGKGAMGVVYLGKDPKIGRVVAIKTLALSQEFEGEELTDARERFFREAETAGRLQHQNIVTIFDAGEEHDLAYIAMEFLKGRDLAEFCREGHLLPPARVLSIVERVAQALAYAHRQNVVHRDIKPANIMYDPASDAVKVTDFGIARITDSSKTKTGLVLGTPSFMSAEQIAGKKVDGRSDLYSLGVMLYQMLTGQLPFRGDSMAELMYKIANQEAPDIRLVRKDIREQLARVVAVSLSKSPEGRFQDGEHFASELRLAISELQTAAGAPDSPPSVHSSEKTVVFAAPNTSVLAAEPYAATQKITSTQPDFEQTVISSRPDGDSKA